ncbi:uncharacterized protein DUF4328 [Naumannella halotolerans]|uniref:Uncharacterized protein DUF4328 n=2 Tax=Naumannella halotolerans TaxID=993414 RepID=A0A4R7J8W6_9ACTN|nr:uncharacterized protein DUF4328 [Naumannella halotolerans]
MSHGIPVRHGIPASHDFPGPAIPPSPASPPEAWPPGPWQTAPEPGPAMGALPRAMICLSAVWLALQIAYLVDSYLAAALWTGQATSAEAWILSDTLWSIYQFTYPVMVTTWILTSIWMYGLRTRIGPVGQRRHPLWAWFGWVIPITWLWVPLQYVRDLARATVGTALDRVWAPWWITWLISSILASISGSLYLGVEEDQVAELLSWLPHVDLLSTACMGVAFILWVRIVRTLAIGESGVRLPTMG